jgi:hypothetical protein
MGKIDDMQDAVNQREPERHQRIDRAGHQAIDDGREQYDGRKHVVIASQRVRPELAGPMTGSAKQSSFCARLDCFVASLLAMTLLIAQRQRRSSNA